MTWFPLFFDIRPTDEMQHYWNWNRFWLFYQSTNASNCESIWIEKLLNLNLNFGACTEKFVLQVWSVFIYRWIASVLIYWTVVVVVFSWFYLIWCTNSSLDYCCIPFAIYVKLIPSSFNPTNHRNETYSPVFFSVFVVVLLLLLLIVFPRKNRLSFIFVTCTSYIFSLLFLAVDLMYCFSTLEFLSFNFKRAKFRATYNNWNMHKIRWIASFYTRILYLKRQKQHLATVTYFDCFYILCTFDCLYAIPWKDVMFSFQ